MSDKERLQRRAPKEMYGPEGVLLEAIGVKSMMRVASDISYVQGRVQELGLNIGEMWTDDDWGTCLVIYRDNEPVRNSLPVLKDPTGSVWVDDVYFDRFKDLIGIDERVME